MALKRSEVQFGYAKSESLPTPCRNCACLKDCWGERPNNRVLCTVAGESGLNNLCAGLHQFFSHLTPKVERFAANIQRYGESPAPRVDLGLPFSRTTAEFCI